MEEVPASRPCLVVSPDVSSGWGATRGATGSPSAGRQGRVREPGRRAARGKENPRRRALAPGDPEKPGRRPEAPYDAPACAGVASAFSSRAARSCSASRFLHSIPRRSSSTRRSRMPASHPNGQLTAGSGPWNLSLYEGRILPRPLLAVHAPAASAEHSVIELVTIGTVESSGDLVISDDGSRVFFFSALYDFFEGTA